MQSDSTSATIQDPSNAYSNIEKAVNTVSESLLPNQDAEHALWLKFFQRVKQLERDLRFETEDQKDFWKDRRKSHMDLIKSNPKTNIWSGHKGPNGRCSPLLPPLLPKLPQYMMPTYPEGLSKHYGAKIRRFLELL